MMNPDLPLQTDTEISDFAEILAEGAEPPVVVGGHAVGIWARYFLEKGVRELAEFLPFRSKDLDLIGTMTLLTRLHQRFRGVMTRSEPRSPVIGRLDLPCGAKGLLRVEVLHMVQGLDSAELQRTVDLRAGDVVARVPLVQLVLKAKIANAATIAQEGRQDVKHVRMLVPCVRAFVLELMRDLGDSGISERSLVNLLEEIRTIIGSVHANKVERLWDVDFTKVWPMAELIALDAPKVNRWLEHCFPSSPA
jgi:hypothetical protein